MRSTRLKIGRTVTLNGSLGTSVQRFANEVTGGRVVVELFRRRDGSDWATGGVFNIPWAF